LAHYASERSGAEFRYGASGGSQRRGISITAKPAPPTASAPGSDGGGAQRYHARVFADRLRELGGKCSASVSEEGRKFLESISDPTVKDTEKLLIHHKLVPDPAARFKSICEFAELIKEDLETKEMVKLFVDDEISSGNWLNSACR
jgi:hypothetical protein